MVSRSIASIVALVAIASLVDAQPSGAQAEVLFRKANKLLDEGKIAEACAAFDASQKLEATTSTLLHQANCREKNEQYATAWGLFLDAARATASATDDAGKQMHQIASDRAAKLEARASTLTINVASPVKGLVVKRDGEVIDPAVFGQALPFDGGKYTVKATAPGVPDWSQTVTLAKEHDTKTVEVPRMEKVAPKPVDKPADKPADKPVVRTDLPQYFWYCTHSTVAKLGICTVQRERCDGFRSASKNKYDYTDCATSDTAYCFDSSGEAHCTPTAESCESLQAVAKQHGDATACETRHAKEVAPPPPPPPPPEPQWWCSESRTKNVGTCKPQKDACESFRTAMRDKVADLGLCSEQKLAHCFDYKKDAHCAPTADICETMRKQLSDAGECSTRKR